MNDLHCRHSFFMNNSGIKKNARKASIVLLITFATMVAEIYFGTITGSMALLADGWHMSTHAAALGITWLTYKLANSPRMVQNFNFGGGKIIALGGFASSVFLLLIALFVAFEAGSRFFHPVPIQFDDALLVAAIGLLINIICAFILKDRTEQNSVDHHSHAHHSHGHHSHGSGDHNIKAAYVHVLADALTSITAIIALLAGRLWGLNWLDPVVGAVGSLVILKWAYELIKDTGWELLDGHAREINFDLLKSRIRKESVEIIDLHAWKVGPGIFAAELVVKAGTGGTISKLRSILEKEFKINHSVIEER